MSNDEKGASTTLQWPTIVLAFAGIAIIGILLLISFAIGFALGDYSVHDRIASDRAARLRSVLESDLETYGKLEVVGFSNGDVIVVGEVDGTFEKERLKEDLVSLYGEEFAERAMGSVTVE